MRNIKMSKKINIVSYLILKFPWENKVKEKRKPNPFALRSNSKPQMVNIIVFNFLAHLSQEGLIPVCVGSRISLGRQSRLSLQQWKGFHQGFSIYLFPPSVKGPRVSTLDTQSYHNLTPPFAVLKQANPQLLEQGLQASCCPRLHPCSQSPYRHSSVPGRRWWWWHRIGCSCRRLSLSLFHVFIVHKDLSTYIHWGKHPFSSRVFDKFSSSCKVRHLLPKDLLICILA